MRRGLYLKGILKILSGQLLSLKEDAPTKLILG